jgi:hypothetical protein
MVAQVLVVADKTAGHRHGRDRDVPDRPSRGVLGTDLLEPGPKLG